MIKIVCLSRNWTPVALLEITYLNTERKNQEERDQLGDLGIDGNIISK
jgi:hypothetical protein